MESEALERVAQRAKSSIVRVYTILESDDDEPDVAAGAQPTSNRLGGTGVIIAGDGVILTNEHVVRNAAAIIVTLPDGWKYMVDRFAMDLYLDLAVLRIDERGLSALAPDGGVPGCGTPVVALAAPGRDRPACHRMGVVTNPAVSLQQELDPTKWHSYAGLIESTTRLDLGFSGGPLLDLQGRLVGLNVASSGHADQEHARGYAIPFDQHARDAIARLLREVTR